MHCYPQRLAVAASYPAELTRLLERILEGHGLEVTGSQSAGVATEWQVGNTSSPLWYDLVCDTDSPEADCPSIACSGIRTAAIVKPLENEPGKPVVSAPTVSIRSAIRPAGV